MVETLSGDAGLELPEFEAPPADPLGLLRRWFELAERRGVREPYAFALATAGADGKASSRIVLLKEVAPALVFAGGEESRKGRELAAVPWAAGTAYWRETLQQVQVAGPVEPLGDAETEAIFAARPRAGQAAAIASRQSEPLADPAALRASAAALAAGGEPLARPAGWRAYRLIPERIEFWHGSPDRLHRRLLYTAAGGGWAHRRLQP